MDVTMVLRKDDAVEGARGVSAPWAAFLQVKRAAPVSGGSLPAPASSCEVTRGHQPRKRVGQLFPIERFDEEAIHACLETGITIVN